MNALWFIDIVSLFQARDSRANVFRHRIRQYVPRHHGLNSHCEGQWQEERLGKS